MERNQMMSEHKTYSFLGDLRWKPDRHTLAAICSYVLVVAALYTAFQVFTTRRVAANFITFGPIALAGLGVALPVLYTVLKRRRPLADIGLTVHQLIPSLALGLLLGWDTYRNTLAKLDIIWTPAEVPLVVMVLAVGLFEAVFFRGWLQTRFEEAFGLVPGVIAGALCYSIYHIGYGMTSSEMLFLFGLGLVFGVAFRLTKNIFVLWPFYTPIGGLYTNLREGLALPFEATYGFILTLGLMAGVITLAAALYKQQQEG
jgi:membrane protease YdiL (CAAX protease family)